MRVSARKSISKTRFARSSRRFTRASKRETRRARGAFAASPPQVFHARFLARGARIAATSPPIFLDLAGPRARRLPRRDRRADSGARRTHSGGAGAHAKRRRGHDWRVDSRGRELDESRLRICNALIHREKIFLACEVRARFCAHRRRAKARAHGCTCAARGRSVCQKMSVRRRRGGANVRQRTHEMRKSIRPIERRARKNGAAIRRLKTPSDQKSACKKIAAAVSAHRVF